MDSKDHYLATQLDELKQWIRPSDTVLWIGVESALMSASDLHTLLADLWKPLEPGNLSLPTQASLLAWRALHCHSLQGSPISDIQIPVLCVQVYYHTTFV